MSFFDIALFLFIAGFVVQGLRKGLIRMLGNLVGLIIGASIASRFYLTFFEWSGTVFGKNENLGKVLAFIIVFVVVAKITDWVFIWIEKLFNLVSFIPFTKFINNLLGGILGLLEGSLFLGLIVFVASRYAIVGSLFGNNLVSSKIAPHLLDVVNLIVPILPEALRALQAIIE